MITEWLACRRRSFHDQVVNRDPLVDHTAVAGEVQTQLDDFAEHFHASRADSLPHTVRFLREWFEFHIDTYDRALVRWLNTGENLLPESTDY